MNRILFKSANKQAKKKKKKKHVQTTGDRGKFYFLSSLDNLS